MPDGSANGNLTVRGADAFSYDAANRLISATMGGVTQTSTYDGDGTRVATTVGSTTTNYVHDLAAGLPLVIDDGVRRYVWGPAGLAYSVETATGAVEVVHADHLGSVRTSTDATGAVTATARYDEFGVPLATTGSSGSPFGFTGEPTDPTGLVHLRTRSYDPALGRFMSRDRWSGSLAAPQTLNAYAYAANNPLTSDDPSGFCADPGGPGLRYCIERWIPEESVGGSAGDHRGYSSDGGSFRVRQWIHQTADGVTIHSPEAGITTMGPLEAEGALRQCGGFATPKDGGGRYLAAACQGFHSFLQLAAPPIYHIVRIREAADGSAAVDWVIGTPYPSLEVWQYGGPDGPRLLFYHNSEGYNPFDLYTPQVLSSEYIGPGPGR